MTVELPIRTISEANGSHGHWSDTANRRKRHRRDAALLMRASGILPPVPPLTITLTRLGARKMDSDNLAGACKGIRDGIADWLGMDDGSESLQWVYTQEVNAKRNGARGVRVEITVITD